MNPVVNSELYPFLVARQLMLDSQIHPMGVVSEGVLESFMQTPREAFVPTELKSVCYCDEDIQVAQGRYLMEPAVLARMIQLLEPQKDHVALIIGSGVGYSAAILSYLISTVVALEEDAELFSHAQQIWDQLSYCNIVATAGCHSEGVPVNAPYDIIMINGAVAEVSQEIKEQLTISGRLIAPIKPAGQSLAKVTLIERKKENVFSESVLFESGTPYLKGFEPKKEFVF